MINRCHVMFRVLHQPVTKVRLIKPTQIRSIWFRPFRPSLPKNGSKVEIDNYIRKETQFCLKSLDKGIRWNQRLIYENNNKYNSYESEDEVLFVDYNGKYIVIDQQVWYWDNKDNKKYAIFTLSDLRHITLKNNIYNKKESEYLMIQNIDLNSKLLCLQFKLDYEEGYHLLILDLKNNNNILLMENDVFNSILINEQVYFTKMDSTLRPFQLFSFKEKQLNLIYEENRSTFFLDIGPLRDKSFISINSSTLSGSEIRLLDLNNQQIEMIHSYVEDVECFVDKNDYTFIVLKQDKIKGDMNIYFTQNNNTNQSAKLNLPSEMIISDVEVFKHHLIIYGTSQQFHNKIMIYDFRSQKFKVVDNMPKVGAIFPIGSKKEYNNNFTQFYYSNPIQGPTLVKLDLESGNIDKLGLNNWDGYTLEVKYVKSTNDNINIPVTEVYENSQANKNQPSPTLIISYGAYGIPLKVDYKTLYVTLIKKGWKLLFAHIRGGSELGLKWYKQSIRQNKMVGINDLIDVIDTYKDGKLAMLATSAGAVATANAYYKRKDKVHAIILDKPFLNPLKAMQDINLPLTNTEVIEWGDINNEKDLKVLEEISSFNYVVPHKNQKLLIISAEKDIRVEQQPILDLVMEYRLNNNSVFWLNLSSAGHASFKNVHFVYAVIIAYLEGIMNNKI